MSTDNDTENGSGNGTLKVVSFRLSLELYDLLDALAKAEGINKSQYLVNMVRERVSGPPPERPTPLFPPEATPAATPQPHGEEAEGIGGEKVEAIVRREVKALAVLLIATDGRSAEDAASLVNAALGGKLQGDVDT